MSNQEEEKKQHRVYKIEIGDKIKVYKKEINGTYIYSTRVMQKKMNGETKFFEKDLTFRKDANVSHEEVIIIKDMFENARENPRDPYHPIYSLMILDFEKVINEKKEEQDAINEFKTYVDILQDERDYLDNEDLPF